MSEKSFILSNKTKTPQEIQHLMMQHLGSTRSVDAIEKIIKESETDMANLAVAEEVFPAFEEEEEEVEVDPACRVEEVECLIHRYWVRPDFEMTVELPANLSPSEASRLASFFNSLSFDYMDDM